MVAEISIIDSTLLVERNVRTSVGGTPRRATVKKESPLSLSGTRSPMDRFWNSGMIVLALRALIPRRSRSSQKGVYQPARCVGNPIWTSQGQTSSRGAQIVVARVACHFGCGTSSSPGSGLRRSRPVARDWRPHASSRPAALAATRRLMRGDRQAIRVQMERESKEFAAALESPEAKAAFSAFLSKARA